MDRAEAIKELMPFTLCDVYSDNLREACQMAIAALREQEQREQGCSGCRGAVYTDELFEVTNPHGVEVDVQFNFCPVCGRKLGGAEG